MTTPKKSAEEAGYAEFTLEHCGQREKLILISQTKLDALLAKERSKAEKLREAYEDCHCGNTACHSISLESEKALKEYDQEET